MLCFKSFKDLANKFKSMIKKLVLKNIIPFKLQILF